MDVGELVTPSTTRRNPPRKAKVSSTKESLGKSTKKVFFTEGKSTHNERRALVSSFTAAEPNDIKIEDQDVPSDIAIEPAFHSLARTGDIERFQDAELIKLEVALDVEQPPVPLENESCNASDKQIITGSGNQKLHVFLRIRPARQARLGKDERKIEKPADACSRLYKITGSKKSLGKNKRGRAEAASVAEASPMPALCLCAQDSRRVTLVAPASCSGSRRPKVEEFDGFSQVFTPEASQEDVFSAVLVPRLNDLLKGESSLVVAMGPTSAGKTYTMLGSQDDPGLLPRSLRYLIGPSESNLSSRKVCISMFEIYSEQGGRSEKILDLLQDGTELSLQQSKVKGLQEATVSTVQEADAVISNSLQRRTTASTAANDRSSRSHCIINISVSEAIQSQADDKLILTKEATLTIADLAGFEREKKTGNQGVRLNESNFINNTSMVFGQCLRALLEHQKNPKKALQKHFQYSMLTRYLKRYLEAKGNMTLVVNVSPCEEDYLDTAFVLRQAAPCSNIRLSLLAPQETVHLPRQKRRGSLTKDRQPVQKRRKVDAQKNEDMHNCGSSPKTDAVQIRSIDEDGYPGCTGDKYYIAKSSIEHDFSAQGQGHGLVDDSSIQHFEIISMPTLASYTTEELKLRVLSEVDQLLCHERVENHKRISIAITEVLEEVLQQHGKAFQALETRMQHQQDEMLRLTTTLMKEQERSAGLSKEVNKLKENCRNLEEQVLTSLRRSDVKDGGQEICSPLQRCAGSSALERFSKELEITPENHGMSGDKGHAMDCSLTEIQRACCGKELVNQICSQSLAGEKKNSTTQTDSQAEEPLHVIHDFVHLSHVQVEQASPSHLEKASVIAQTEEEVIEVRFVNEDCSVPAVELSCTKGQLMDNHLQEQYSELNSLACSNEIPMKEVSDHRGAFTACIQSYSDADSGDAQNEFALNNPEISKEDGQIDTSVVVVEFLQKPQIMEESEKGFVALQEKAQVEAKLEARRSNEHYIDVPVQELLICQEECKKHPESQVDGVDVLHLQSLSTFSGTEHLNLVVELDLPVDNKPTEVLLLEQEAPKCDLSDVHIDRSSCDIEEEFTQRGIENKFSTAATADDFNSMKKSKEVSGNLAGQTCGNSAPQESQHSNLCLQQSRKSHLQKGRLLALSLTRQCSLSAEKEISEEVHPTLVACTNAKMLGPIGVDLEEILGLSITEIENGVWNHEAAAHQRVSNLLADNGGILDINNFKKRYSVQRSMCVRYCLAVICNKMNVDGQWIPLLEVNSNSRRRNFLAVIQARTVGEACGHARVGFQEEGLAMGTMTPARVQFKEPEDCISNSPEKRIVNRISTVIEKTSVEPKVLLIDLEEDCKENAKKSPQNTERRNPNRSLTEPSKRRKLQPVSSLSLQANSNMSTGSEFLETTQDEVNPSWKRPDDGEVEARLLRRDTTSLAYLLTCEKQ